MIKIKINVYINIIETIFLTNKCCVGEYFIYVYSMHGSNSYYRVLQTVYVTTFSCRK